MGSDFCRLTSIANLKDKKWRDAVDAPLKDKVVHWMLYKRLRERWEPRFIADSYGNIRGRGTHRAVRRLAAFCRKQGKRYVASLDVAKYFYSVRHDILKQTCLRHEGDQDVRILISDLIDSFATDDRYDHLFPSDSPYHRTKAKGMPLGNLISQIFANIYLNGFDHWVKEDLGERFYIRYVDDIAVVGDNRHILWNTVDLLSSRLNAIGLWVNPCKVSVRRIDDGIPFLGYVIWKNHVSAGSYVRRRYARALRKAEFLDNRAALQSYRAFFTHTGRMVP